MMTAAKVLGGQDSCRDDSQISKGHTDRQTRKLRMTKDLKRNVSGNREKTKASINLLQWLHTGSGFHAEKLCSKIYAGKVSVRQTSLIEAEKAIGNYSHRNFADTESQNWLKQRRSDHPGIGVQEFPRSLKWAHSWSGVRNIRSYYCGSAGCEGVATTVTAAYPSTWRLQ